MAMADLLEFMLWIIGAWSSSLVTFLKSRHPKGPIQTQYKKYIFTITYELSDFWKLHVPVL